MILAKLLTLPPTFGRMHLTYLTVLINRFRNLEQLFLPFSIKRLHRLNSIMTLTTRGGDINTNQHTAQRSNGNEDEYRTTSSQRPNSRPIKIRVGTIDIIIIEIITTVLSNKGSHARTTYKRIETTYSATSATTAKGTITIVIITLTIPQSPLSHSSTTTCSITASSTHNVGSNNIPQIPHTDPAPIHTFHTANIGIIIWFLPIIIIILLLSFLVVAVVIMIIMIIIMVTQCLLVVLHLPHLWSRISSSSSSSSSSSIRCPHRTTITITLITSSSSSSHDRTSTITSITNSSCKGRAKHGPHGFTFGG
mmetsp:Transcript_21165/g.33219  ORF Transcript_21165/g.33219 Transcript_21165/m.33219 type:complete len:308 (-) Transcript_21165:410-1333(-)